MVEHALLVRGNGLSGPRQATPAVVAMRDLDFPERFFADLGLKQQQRTSTARLLEVKAGKTHLHLLQPVQRMLQVALVDVCCNELQEPRLDPLRIESAGLVIRRIPRRDNVDLMHAVPEAWVQSTDGRFDWKQLTASEAELDPDPKRRPGLFSGQAELDRLLGAHLERTARTERVDPAFVVPPEVCERTQKTLIYALISTASSDVAGQATAPPEFDDDSLRNQLPPFLQEGSHGVPFAGNAVDHNYMSSDYCKSNDAQSFLSVIYLLQVVAIEFAAFDGSYEGNELVRALNRREVEYDDGTKRGLGDFLELLKAYLLDYDPEKNSPFGGTVMPVKCTPCTAADEDAVLKAAKACLRAKSNAQKIPTGRYQDHTRLYVFRLFLRVRGHAGCPLELVWSEYSAPFEIAPWYESAGVCGPPVPLPTPTRDFLKNLKPNVSFVMSDSLMTAAQATDLNSLLLGSGPSLPGPGLSWVCSFSIPIITICAFIVLNIFLSLLNIIFWWLPFVKTCFPLPSVAARAQGGD